MVVGETRVALEVGCISFTKLHLTSNDTANHIEIIQIPPLKGHDLTIMLQIANPETLLAKLIFENLIECSIASYYLYMFGLI